MPNDERSLLDSAKAQFLKRPEVLNVRLGYRFEKGWITRERALVVTVAAKKTQFDLRRQGLSALPQSLAGYPVQLTGPMLRELVGGAIPQTSEFLSLSGWAQLQRNRLHAAQRAAGDHQRAHEAAASQQPRRGWPCLSEFLARTRERLVIGMYDFGAQHILNAILAKPALKEVVLVMQRGESIGTGTKKDAHHWYPLLPAAACAVELFGGHV